MLQIFQRFLSSIEDSRSLPLWEKCHRAWRLNWFAKVAILRLFPKNITCNVRPYETWQQFSLDLRLRGKFCLLFSIVCLDWSTLCIYFCLNNIKPNRFARKVCFLTVHVKKHTFMSAQNISRAYRCSVSTIFFFFLQLYLLFGADRCIA